MTLIACILGYCALFGMTWCVRYVLSTLDRHTEVCETIRETASLIEQFDNSSRVQFQETKADASVSLVGQIAAGAGIRCEYCHSIVPKDKINCPNCGAPR